MQGQGSSRAGARRMRRTLVFLTIACALVPASASASIRSRNKIDHWKHSASWGHKKAAPESTTIDYGPDGQLNSRLWEAAAVNPYDQYVLYVWERGRVYYQNGKCTSKPTWSDDYYIYGQNWNKYQFESKNAVKNQGSGPPAWRYRRVMYHFYAGWKDVLSIHKDKYV